MNTAKLENLVEELVNYLNLEGLEKLEETINKFEKAMSELESGVKKVTEVLDEKEVLPKVAELLKKTLTSFSKKYRDSLMNEKVTLENLLVTGYKLVVHSLDTSMLTKLIDIIPNELISSTDKLKLKFKVYPIQMFGPAVITHRAEQLWENRREILENIEYNILINVLSSEALMHYVNENLSIGKLIEISKKSLEAVEENESEENASDLFTEEFLKTLEEDLAKAFETAEIELEKSEEQNSEEKKPILFTEEFLKTLEEDLAKTNETAKVEHDLEELVFEDEISDVLEASINKLKDEPQLFEGESIEEVEEEDLKEEDIPELKEIHLEDQILEKIEKAESVNMKRNRDEELNARIDELLAELFPQVEKESEVEVFEGIEFEKEIFLSSDKASN